jgi:hypothetical protein
MYFTPCQTELVQPPQLYSSRFGSYTFQENLNIAENLEKHSCIPFGAKDELV